MIGKIYTMEGRIINIDPEMLGGTPVFTSRIDFITTFGETPIRPFPSSSRPLPLEKKSNGQERTDDFMDTGFA